jgi:hypothetical protein
VGEIGVMQAEEKWAENKYSDSSLRSCRFFKPTQQIQTSG